MKKQKNKNKILNLFVLFFLLLFSVALKVNAQTNNCASGLTDLPYALDELSQQSNLCTSGETASNFSYCSETENCDVKWKCSGSQDWCSGTCAEGDCIAFNTGNSPIGSCVAFNAADTVGMCVAFLGEDLCNSITYNSSSDISPSDGITGLTAAMNAQGGPCISDSADYDGTYGIRHNPANNQWEWQCISKTTGQSQTCSLAYNGQNGGSGDTNCVPPAGESHNVSIAHVEDKIRDLTSGGYCQNNVDPTGIVDGLPQFKSGTMTWEWQCGSGAENQCTVAYYDPNSGACNPIDFDSTACNSPDDCMLNFRNAVASQGGACNNFGEFVVFNASDTVPTMPYDPGNSQWTWKCKNNATNQVDICTLPYTGQNGGGGGGGGGVCNNNGTCENDKGENNDNCPNDCPLPPGGCNNNGTCEQHLGENNNNCSSDCPVSPGGCNNNGTCQPDIGENNTTCPNDCPVPPGGCNNNGTCEQYLGETPATCPNDCSGGGGGGTSETNCSQGFDKASAKLYDSSLADAMQAIKDQKANGYCKDGTNPTDVSNEGYPIFDAANALWTWSCGEDDCQAAWLDPTGGTCNPIEFDSSNYGSPESARLDLREKMEELGPCTYLGEFVEDFDIPFNNTASQWTWKCENKSTGEISTCTLDYTGQNSGGGCNNNGTCEADKGENNNNCPVDCPLPPGGCNNNGTCEQHLGENNNNCPNDCPVSPVNCNNNGTCEPNLGENNETCPVDCPVPPGGCNNNGTCEQHLGETPATCPTDCPITPPPSGETSCKQGFDSASAKLYDSSLAEAMDKIRAEKNDGYCKSGITPGGVDTSGYPIFDYTNKSWSWSCDGDSCGAAWFAAPPADVCNPIVCNTDDFDSPEDALDFLEQNIEEQGGYCTTQGTYVGEDGVEYDETTQQYIWYCQNNDTGEDVQCSVDYTGGAGDTDCQQPPSAKLFDQSLAEAMGQMENYKSNGYCKDDIVPEAVDSEGVPKFDYIEKEWTWSCGEDDCQANWHNPAAGVCNPISCDTSNYNSPEDAFDFFEENVLDQGGYCQNGIFVGSDGVMYDENSEKWIWYCKSNVTGENVECSHDYNGENGDPSGSECKRPPSASGYNESIEQAKDQIALASNDGFCKDGVTASGLEGGFPKFNPAETKWTWRCGEDDCEANWVTEQPGGLCPGTEIMENYEQSLKNNNSPEIASRELKNFLSTDGYCSMLGEYNGEIGVNYDNNNKDWQWVCVNADGSESETCQVDYLGTDDDDRNNCNRTVSANIFDESQAEAEQTLKEEAEATGGYCEAGDPTGIAGNGLPVYDPALEEWRWSCGGNECIAHYDDGIISESACLDSTLLINLSQNIIDNRYDNPEEASLTLKSELKRMGYCANGEDFFDTNSHIEYDDETDRWQWYCRNDEVGRNDMCYVNYIGDDNPDDPQTYCERPPSAKTYIVGNKDEAANLVKGDSDNGTNYCANDGEPQGINPQGLPDSYNPNEQSWMWTCSKDGDTQTCKAYWDSLTVENTCNPSISTPETNQSSVRSFDEPAQFIDLAGCEENASGQLVNCDNVCTDENDTPSLNFNENTNLYTWQCGETECKTLMTSTQECIYQFDGKTTLPPDQFGEYKDAIGSPATSGLTFCGQDQLPADGLHGVPGKDNPTYIGWNCDPNYGN